MSHQFQRHYAGRHPSANGYPHALNIAPTYSSAQTYTSANIAYERLHAGKQAPPGSCGSHPPQFDEYRGPVYGVHHPVEYQVGNIIFLSLHLTF